MDSVIYALFAIFGLSFLIFIHELGHLLMARHLGMKVEVFSIGFGKPLFSFYWKGVKCQWGWIPFGGYVKIAGTETDKGIDPYLVKDGFFGKTPWDRVKVAFAGPFVNIVFAFLMFTVLFFIGGREKKFAEYTNRIGWVDVKSELYEKGVRPGDEIVSYNGKPYESMKDHMYAPMTSKGKIEVKGFHIDDLHKTKTPFSYDVEVYPHPLSLEKGIVTSGIFSPASYLIYEKGKEIDIPKSVLLDTLKEGDRLLAVDGELVFSDKELTYLVNNGKALLTIERNGEILLARVPRVPLSEYRLTSLQKQEILDWQFEAKLKEGKKGDFVMIPYNLNEQGVVEGTLKFIDKDKKEEAFSSVYFSSLEKSLQPEDRILAVDGAKVHSAHEIFARLQSKKVAVMVERLPLSTEILSVEEANKVFNAEINGEDFSSLWLSLGTDKPLAQKGNLLLVSGITAKPQKSFITSHDQAALYAASVEEQKKWARTLPDPEKRKEAIQFLDKKENTLFLGLPGIQDEKVAFNLPPEKMFVSVFKEVVGTLGALVTGSLNPKWMSGPIGIVQMVQTQWSAGLKEAIFWLGAISLNLGILNLLPIPVLDGGTILISGIEMVTGKRMSVKSLEKLTLPFGILMIIFFVFLTYNDLLRLLSKFL